MKKSLEQRADLYRESSCIEEYCVKRDLQMPSFRWKLFDSIVFCCKHQVLIQTIWNNSTAFPFIAFGLLVGGVLTAVCKYVFYYCYVDLFLMFVVSLIVSSFLALAFFLMLCNVCFELRILQIRKK